VLSKAMVADFRVG